MDRSQIQQPWHEFFRDEILDGDDAGLDADTPVLELGLIDSLSMVSLLAFIDESFGIQIPDDQVRPEHFANLRVLADFISGLGPGDGSGGSGGSGGADTAMDRLVSMVASQGVDHRQIDVAGDARFHVLELGRGSPTIVLLPPPGNPSITWADSLRALGSSTRSVAVDLAGFGASTAPSPAPDFRQHVELTAALLDELGGPAVLAGNSASAVLALEVARARPSLVTGLVLSGFGLPEAPAPWWADLRDLGRDLDTAMTRAYYRPPSLTKAMRAVLAEGLSTDAYTRFFADDAIAGVGELAAEIACPVLLVRGDEDAIVSAADVDRLAARIDRARIARIPRCGHFPQVERPEELALVVKDLVAELGGQP